jgi:GNAT superfamily N-acetyltransferase
VKIRKATLEDAEAIATVHVASWQAAYKGIMPEQFLKTLSLEARAATWRKLLQAGTSQALVAQVDEVIIGWIAFGACRDKDKYSNWAEIEALYVLPEFWRKGIGGRLSDSARQLLHTAGYTFATLWVLSENHHARAFYQRNGFTQDDSSKLIQIGGVQLTEIRYHCALP